MHCTYTYAAGIIGAIDTPHDVSQVGWREDTLQLRFSHHGWGESDTLRSQDTETQKSVMQKKSNVPTLLQPVPRRQLSRLLTWTGSSTRIATICVIWWDSPRNTWRPT